MNQILYKSLINGLIRVNRIANPKLIIILFVLINISCSKKATYDFEVSNETDYFINTFVIGSGDDKVKISINPNETSEIVSYEFGGTYFNFAEPMMSLAVKQYSDSIEVYDYNTGGGTSIPDLYKNKTNRIKISLDKESTDLNVVFLIETNN